MRRLLHIVGARKGHDHAVDQRGNRLRHQGLVPLRDHWDILSHQLRQFRRPDIGTVYDSLCLHIPLVGLHAGDPSAQGTESRDLRIGGKFHAHAPCTPGVGLRAVKRIRVPVLLTEGGSEHALRVKIRNDLLRLFQGNGAGIDAQTVLHL